MNEKEIYITCDTAEVICGIVVALAFAGLFALLCIV